MSIGFKVTPQHWLAPKECPFTYHGRNLAHYRGGELRKIFCGPLGLEHLDSKQQLLQAIIAKFKLLEAEQEVAEWVDRGRSESG